LDHKVCEESLVLRVKMDPRVQLERRVPLDTRDLLAWLAYLAKEVYPASLDRREEEATLDHLGLKDHQENKEKEDSKDWQVPLDRMVMLEALVILVRLDLQESLAQRV